jgi:RNA polymerase sigma-70 factor (ECF subfamily)
MGGGSVSDRPVDLESFYASTYRRLVSVVGVALGDRHEAEEIVQEAFARLLPRWDTVRRYEDPEAWVRQVAFRLMSNRLRSLRRGRHALERAGERLGEPTAPDLTADTLRALARLPLPQRQVVVLHHLVGLPVDSVAAELRVAAGTVKSRLSRARAALAPLLREES